jgi:hypothetical protein
MHVLEHFGDVMKRIQEGVVLYLGEFLAMEIKWSCEVGVWTTTFAIKGTPRLCGPQASHNDSFKSYSQYIIDATPFVPLSLGPVCGKSTRGIGFVCLMVK